MTSQYKNPVWLWASGVLTAGLVLTGVLWSQSKTAATEQLQSDLQREADDITGDIERNLSANALLLKGFQGLFVASDQVTRKDFREYFETLRYTATAQGFAGVAYVEKVTGPDLPRHLARVRQDGLPQYQIHPAGARPDYTPIVYIEPFEGSNLRALGFDISTTVPTVAAMALARDSGELVMSGKLNLKQDEGQAQPSFVMYGPVYRTNTRLDTVAARQANLVGWVDAPFRVVDLMAKVLPTGLRNLNLKIYDGLDPSAEALMFDSDAARASVPAGLALVTQKLSFAGRQWTLVFQADVGYGAAAIRQRPSLIATTGVLLSLLLSLLTALLLRTQQRREQAVLLQAAESAAQAREALRAQNEQALQESLWAMNEAQRIGQVGTFVIDIQRGTWEASAALYDIFGVDAAFEKTIASWISVIAPDHQQQVMADYQRVIAGDKLNIDYPIIRPSDGRRRWVNAQGQFTMDAQGQPTVLRGTLRDITPRKAAELELQKYRDHLEELVRQRTAELQSSQALLNATLNATAEGILVMDRQESVMLWNQRFVDMWRIPASLVAHPDAALGREHMLTQVADPQALLDGTTLAYQQRGQTHSILVLQMADGRYLRRSVQPQQIGTETVGWVWSYTDITEFKRAESAANAANQAKSTFLANMSHEIRTPMNGVIGMLDVLQQTPLLPEQKRMLDTVAHSSQSLLHILNDILDYSKIEAGQFTVEHIATPLKALAESVLQLMQGAASGQGVALSMTLAPGLPAAIYTDPTRLRQVLLNLIGNAIKFSPGLSGRAARVVLHLEPGYLPDGQAALLLQVSDNGIGMSDAVVDKLFTPFTQADASTARQFGGTGLGLSISQRLVALLGGQISVRSTPGQGSRFTVMLPLHEAHLENASTDVPQERRLRSRTAAPSLAQAAASDQLILLAEDNETNRDVLREQLRLLGYAAEVADDGVAALAQWRTGRYALLLTDCHMPKMDGFALTAAIRAEEAPGQRRPIIAVTANAMQGEAEHCLACGMDDFLSKPLRLQELGPMLVKWLPLAGDVQPGLAGQAALLPPPDVAQVPESGSAEAIAAPELLHLAQWDAATLGQMVGDNPGLHQRLLDKFLTHAARQVQVIDAAAHAGELLNAALVAHTLKSSARAVGALRLGELCEQIETAGHAGDAVAFQTLVAKLAGTFESTRLAILAGGQRS